MKFKAMIFGVAFAIATSSASAQLINEFQPNPVGADPADVSIELMGTPNAAFSGWFLSFETDTDSPHAVDRATAVSGSFDANGILVVSVPDLENPSFTVALVDDFTGTAGTDSFDSSDVAGSLAALGINTVFDAIGSPDAAGDEVRQLGALLGGTDFLYTGDEPQLIFRDSLDPSIIYAINDNFSNPTTEAFDQFGNSYDLATAFFTAGGAPVDLSVGANTSAQDTFGGANFTTIPEPATMALLGMGGIALIRRRR